MKASIQILEGNGYVWDAEVARWLRQECGIVGSMVGGVAAFKQQNAVHGLPLELSPEEVTLALERGWGALQAPLHTAALAAALGADAGRKRGRGQPSAYQYYAEDEEEEDAYMEDLPMAQQPAVEPTWRAALTGSTGFTLPSTPEEAAAANAGQPWPAPAAAAAVAPAGGADAQAAAAAEGANAQPAAAPDGAAAQPAAAAAAADEGGGAPPLEWSWPGTEAERHRYWVFRDLHAKGYRITGGSKFGADYLVYPGDPTLYHAQFCVRLVGHAAPLLPVMLASATRGSHQARKHLLLASVTLEGGAGAGGDGVGARGGGGGGGAQGQQEQQEQQQPGQQQPGQQQQQQGEEPGWRSEASWRSDAPAVAAGGEAQPGRRAGGVGAGGEQYRIHYMTIGPVEGFGG